MFLVRASQRAIGDCGHDNGVETVVDPLTCESDHVVLFVRLFSRVFRLVRDDTVRATRSGRDGGARTGSVDLMRRTTFRIR